MIAEEVGDKLTIGKPEEIGLEDADYNTLNRANLRAYERASKRRYGCFTKISLGKRKSIRRKKKKAAKAARKLAR